MSAPISPNATSSAKPLPDLTDPNQPLTNLPASVTSPSNPPVAKVHNIGIIVIGQLLVPLLLLGAGYLVGKQLSFASKNQITDPTVPLSPLLSKVKNLSTTALGGLGLNAALLCYRQATEALNQNHTLAQFLTDDLLTPSLKAGYNYLSNPTISNIFGAGAPAGDAI